MLYRVISKAGARAIPDFKGIVITPTADVFLMPDQGAADNAALGFVARSGDWGWETWGSAAVNAAAVGLAGLADKCTDIAAAIRRQKEAGHGEDGA